MLKEISVHCKKEIKILTGNGGHYRHEHVNISQLLHTHTILPYVTLRTSHLNALRSLYENRRIFQLLKLMVSFLISRSIINHSYTRSLIINRSETLVTTQVVREFSILETFNRLGKLDV